MQQNNISSHARLQEDAQPGFGMAAVSRLPNRGKLSSGEDYLVPAAFLLLKIPAWSRSQITSFAGQDGMGRDGMGQE